MDPAWTDFSKRIYYSEYEVTALLRKGENCLGVALAMAFTSPYRYENGDVEISGKT